MKKSLLYITLIITSVSFAQKIDTKEFIFEETNIQYDRIDYSKYGVTSFFITVYEDIEENEKILKKSINCLKRKKNLYHTLYYFMKIPNEIKTLDKKNKLFSAFVSHLKKVENLEKSDLLLNFDIDYSHDYKSFYDSNFSIKRITTNIKPRKICKTL